MKDYYAILQVIPSAEQEVIEAAYRRLARKYHPDVYSGPDAAHRMRELNEAYEVLGDPHRRAEYDAERRFARARAGARGQHEGPPPPPPPPSPPAGGPQKAQGPTAEAAPRRHRTRPAWPLLAAGPVLAVAIAGALAVATVILAGQGQREGAQPAALRVTPIITAVATVAPTTAVATLNVVGVQTTYGVAPPPTSNPSKSSIEVSLPFGYSDRLAAYDGGGIIVVAPLGWTGTGSVGANGNRSIDLQPVSTTSKGEISVSIASEGTGSALSGAAPFFSWVRSHWQELGMTFQAPAPPLGINTTFATNSLIRYTLPTTSDGLEIDGVAFSNAQDHLESGVGFEIIGVAFENMEVALPAAQHDLAMVILDTFISQEGLLPQSGEVALPTLAPTPLPTPAATRWSWNIGAIGPTQVTHTPLGQSALQCTSRQCIANEAVAAGMSTEAIAFYSEYGVFLRDFEEKGRVDWGWISDPLYDQGRGGPAFLNGPPGVLTVDEALGCVSDLASDAKHGCLEYGPEARLWAWAQYGTLKSVESHVFGQTFVVTIPLSECRACQTERELEVAFMFDGDGDYMGRGLSQE